MRRYPVCVLATAVIFGNIFFTHATAQTIGALLACEIVIPANPLPHERYAASEFQQVFALATRAKLPIVSTPTKPSRQRIYIGNSAALRKSTLAIDASELATEEHRIVIRQGQLAIVGGGTRGTLYGVYTFLEDFLGVRFLTVDHTHAPQVPLDTPLPRTDRKYRPRFTYRYAAYQINPQNPDFAARLRCNTVTPQPRLGGNTPIGLAGHSFYRQVPWNKYSKTFPEYFGLRNGITIQKQYEAQLCLTNPDVLQIVTKAVLDELAANPTQRSIAVSQNDWGHKCTCDRCEAIDRREESGAGSLLRFVNVVATRVAESHPDVAVGTLAYYYSQKPPKTIRARDNVYIQLTSHDCSITDPIATSDYPASATFRRDLAGWGRIAKRVHLWYYNTDFAMYHMPIPNMLTLGPNIRYFAAQGVTGVFAQSVFNAPHAGLNDLMNYLTARLLWNPDADSDALMNEFLLLHYGDAGHLIRDYIDRIHSAAAEQGIQHGWVGHARHYGIDPALAQQGSLLFAKAIAEAPNATLRSRLEKASIGTHMGALSEALTWIWPPGDDKLPVDVARRTRPHFRQYFALCRKYGITHWEEASTNETMRQYLKVGFGLKPDEPW
ncbi:MAG: DUF4838 domain-containing protein [Planctomycetota bacterium]|nr:DUF4838 domain-containing protein [Planctomycetota bacterium]